VKATEATTAPAATGLRWWREVIYILAFYGIYTLVRDTQGSAGKGATAPSTTAYRHARSVIRVEKDLWLFHENSIQHAFVGYSHLFFQFWNVWYGSAHFVVTAGVVIYLFRRQPWRYPYWRNTLALVTGLALVGFAVFPLMPPRLLPHPPYNFIDTLRVYGGSWSFDSGGMQKVSNQFAAMPSLHIGWSTWCACALYPALRQWWSKALVIAYPVVTLFCIIVTANHYFLDALGGLCALSLAALISKPLTAWTSGRQQIRAAA